MRTQLHDAAKQAARDERDRLGNTTSDYVIGRIVEAVLTALGHTTPPQPDPLDCEGWDE